jgi:pimeloyl-ACP methyl ester carboxylesterase
VFYQHFMGTMDDHDPALSDAFARPDLVRRLVLVGTGPRGGEGMPGLGRGAVRPQVPAAGRHVAADPVRADQDEPGGRRAYIERIVARADRDTPVSDQSIAAQRAAIAAYGAAKDPSYANLKGLELPVLVVNGTDDIIIPTINSYILQQFLPDAELILYPDAGHGSHFQYPGLFVRHARIFLDD